MIGVILGSGLAEALSAIEARQSIALDKILDFELAGKIPPAGHHRRLILGRYQGRDVAVLQGRLHFYEGFPMEVVVEPVRYLKTLGVDTLVLSFAGGAIKSRMRAGDLMVLKDHLHLQSANPLHGTTRFVDCSAIYDAGCRKHLLEVARKLKIRLHEGVYASLDGPSYETPAEVRALARLGADMVGMSVTAEAIFARSLGMRVVGLGWVSNLASGVKGAAELSHEEILELGRKVQRPFSQLLFSLLEFL